MTSILFISVVIGIFLLTFASEAEDLSEVVKKPAGLLRWFITGNWPAKVGAGLMIIGFGALLRYLMLSINLQPQIKLIFGVAASFILGSVSAWLRDRSDRRAIHLSMGGASLGVAYLTAYSAYAYLGYIDNFHSLCLLFLVAGAATAFATSSRAMSVAILAMLGAYIAPAFAYYGTADATALIVYGYYLVVSLLCLLMVYMRGWRPIIHLSFLFTLAGGLFFGWTRGFYLPENYEVMQPLLLALVAVHLVMPLVEYKKSETEWINYFDSGYFFLLPTVALVLILTITPSIDEYGCNGVLGLAGLWLLASLFQYYTRRAQVWRYASISLIYFIIAILIALPDQPWYLIGMMLSAVIYALVPRLEAPAIVRNTCASLILFFFACYVLSLSWSSSVNPFFNIAFLQNMLVSLLLGGVALSKRNEGVLGSVFKVVATIWFMFVFLLEIFYLRLANLPQLFYLCLLGISFIYALWLSKHPVSAVTTSSLTAAVILFGFLVVNDSFWSEWLLWVILLSGQIIFSLIAFYSDRQANDGEQGAGITRSLLPLILLPWAVAIAKTVEGSANYVAACFVVGSALFASVQAQLFCPAGRFWPNTLSPVGLIIFGIALIYTTLFHIERGIWPMAFDVITLTYLLISTRWLIINKNRDVSIFVVLCLLVLIAFLQAFFLRLFGPENQTVMTVLDLWTMRLPALVSLMWVMLGASLCVFSNRLQSRSLWSAGALLLGIATVKLVIFDFGSLNQLGNIIAMILSGGVFMGLAWFAPLPPKAERVKSEGVTQNNSHEGKKNILVSHQNDEPRVWIWVVAVLLILFLMFHNALHRQMSSKHTQIDLNQRLHLYR